MNGTSFIGSKFVLKSYVGDLATLLYMLPIAIIGLLVLIYFWKKDFDAETFGQGRKKNKA